MRTRSLLAAIAAGILTLGITSPASAATSGITTATITVQGGSLSITVPTDARGAIAGSGWVASVISSVFTPPAGPAIPASAVSYTAGTIVKIGTATYTANDPGNLTGVVAAVTA